MLPTCFTIGYLGLQVSELERWCAAWDTVVIDTRIKPWSRDPEWRLSEMAVPLGSRYLWVRDFGNWRYRETDPDAIDLVNPERGIQLAARLLKTGSICCLC